MPDPDTASRVDARLTELEIKLSYSEDALDRLNEVIVRQQVQIDALVREVLALRNQAGSSEAGTAPFRSLRDDLPPHY